MMFKENHKYRIGGYIFAHMGTPWNARIGKMTFGRFRVFFSYYPTPKKFNQIYFRTASRKSSH